MVQPHCWERVSTVRNFLISTLHIDQRRSHTNDLTIQYNQKTEVRWCTSTTDDFVDMCVTAGGAALPSDVYRHALAAPRNGSCDVSSSRLTEFAFEMCIGCSRGECRVIVLCFWRCAVRCRAELLKAINAHDWTLDLSWHSAVILVFEWKFTHRFISNKDSKDIDIQ